MRPKPLVSLVAAVAVLAAASTVRAGGIDDQPCPNVAGENTNTCPTGTVGEPYAIRFVERAGSGCGPGKQTFHVDSGIAPPGLSLSLDGTFTGVPEAAGGYRFYVEMREPRGEPDCAGKETQKQFTLVVRRPLAIVPPRLRAYVGRRLRASFRASGGSGRFRWSLAGGRLPRGLELGPRGTLFGKVPAAGLYRFTVAVTDTEMRSARWTGALLVVRSTIR